MKTKNLKKVSALVFSIVLIVTSLCIPTFAAASKSITPVTPRVRLNYESGWKEGSFSQTTEDFNLIGGTTLEINATIKYDFFHHMELRSDAVTGVRLYKKTGDTYQLITFTSRVSYNIYQEGGIFLFIYNNGPFDFNRSINIPSTGTYRLEFYSTPTNPLLSTKISADINGIGYNFTISEKLAAVK